ncbi:intradiol ring-cleavage dioxygenase [Pontibacter locisalis]|uniref:Intradiol ring-cleavage dioxygenase n=1 Tax=Pontibacter locisalis TaxID=1719035 RepID=A0ABW5IME6_9BACT
MKKPLALFLAIFLAISCKGQEGQKQLQAFGRCDGCEAVLEFGKKELAPVDTLPDFDKHEPKLKLTGTVYQPDGKTPAPNVVLFVYHTNPEGKYPKKGDEKGWAKMQGYVRGWVKTDEKGQYTIYTFKPGSYGSGAAHIHAAVLEPDGKYYFIDDYTFEGDPNLGDPQKSKNKGGAGLVMLRNESGLQAAERDIVLGLHIPDYE